MEREIEFRAKSAFDNDWRYGYLIKTRKGNFAIVNDEVSFSLVSEDVIGQYTGMKDKYGKKIYEGDIVLQRGYKGKERMVVRFEDGAFIVGHHSGSSTKPTPMLLNEKCEVVGNIYDNPESM